MSFLFLQVQIQIGIGFISDLAVFRVLKDAGLQSDCSNVVKTSIERLGGLDIVVSNAVSPRLDFLPAPLFCAWKLNSQTRAGPR